MKIRPLQKKDIPQAAEIVRLNYSKKFVRPVLIELKAAFKNKIYPPKYVIVEDKGKVIGFAGYMPAWMDYGIYEIFWINITPKEQGKGIGKKLVKAVLGIIKKKGVNTILLTTRYPKFYSNHFSFKTISRFGRNRNQLMMLDAKR